MSPEGRPALAPSLSARLATQLGALPLLLRGAGPADLARRPASGKWSARENLAHLARHHEVFLDRIRRILGEQARYRAEADPEWPRWPAVATDELLARLRDLRTQLLGLVGSLSAEQLARVGVHPTLGEMTVSEWLEFFLLHEAHHLYVVMTRARGG